MRLARVTGGEAAFGRGDDMKVRRSLGGMLSVSASVTSSRSGAASRPLADFSGVR